MKNKIFKRIVFISFVLFLAVMLFNLSQKYYLELQYLTYPIEYEELVEQYSQEFKIDRYLLYAFINTESGFDENAVSSADARGLTQITNDTFDWIKSKLCPDEDLVFDDLFKPEVSIRFGAYLISESLQRYNNDISTAAAAYHSGWGLVDDLLIEQESDVLLDFPYEQMNNYVSKINKAYNTYLELYTI